jgi:hypothetical protein
MLRWFPAFRVATACLSCSPADLNVSKLTPLTSKSQPNNFSKILRAFFQATAFIVLTSSFSYHLYHTDEQAKPRKQSVRSPPPNKLKCLTTLSCFFPFFSCFSNTPYGSLSTKRHCDRFSSQYFGSRLSASLHQCSITHPSTCFCYQKDKRTKPGNLSKRNYLSEIGEHWTAKRFDTVVERLTSSAASLFPYGNSFSQTPAMYILIFIQKHVKQYKVKSSRRHCSYSSTNEIPYGACAVITWCHTGVSQMGTRIS